MDESMDDMDDTKDDVEELMRQLYGDEFDQEEDEESNDSEPGSYAPTARHNVLLSENFDFQNEGNGGVTALRLIVGPRDIRRLQRFAHLTTMKTLSTSSIAGEMYKLTNQQNQITDLNFYEWCDDFVEMNLSLPGEISWVKERFLSMFSVLSRDGMNTMELSDIVSGLTMFTQGSIDKFRLAFNLYDEDQDGRLTRIEMLRFLRSLLSLIFAVSESNCVALDDIGNVIESNAKTLPTVHNKQLASNFGSVKFVARLFSQITPSTTTVSFQQFTDWLADADEGSSGHWLSTVLEYAPR